MPSQVGDPPRPLVAVVAGPVGTLGVGDLAQLPNQPPQLRRIDPAGRLQQDRVGLELHMLREVLGAVGHHSGVRGRDLPSTQGSRRLR
jgi:hypothetical protein